MRRSKTLLLKLLNVSRARRRKSSLPFSSCSLPFSGDFTIRRRDGNENVKNNNRFSRQKNNFARASYLFVHFFAVFSTTTWNCLILLFREDVNFILCLYLNMVLRNSTPGGFAYIWQSKWVGTIVIKTERKQIHFWSDVFAAFASSYRKSLLCFEHLPSRLGGYVSLLPEPRERIMDQRGKRPVQSLGYVNFIKVIFRPIKRLKLIGSWFPERSTNLFFNVWRKNYETFCSLAVWPLKYSKILQFQFSSCVNLKIIFRNTCRIKSFFPYKDRPNRFQRSKVIHEACCWNCNDFYIGKTKRRLHDRKTEHFKSLTKNDHSSAIAGHVTAARQH